MFSLKLTFQTWQISSSAKPSPNYVGVGARLTGGNWINTVSCMDRLPICQWNPTAPKMVIYVCIENEKKTYKYLPTIIIKLLPEEHVRMFLNTFDCYSRCCTIRTNMVILNICQVALIYYLLVYYCRSEYFDLYIISSSANHCPLLNIGLPMAAGADES